MRELVSVRHESPHIRYGDTAQRRHHRCFKKNVGLVLPPVASTGAPNHQPAGDQAGGDAAQHGGNWIPSLVLYQLEARQKKTRATKRKRPRTCKLARPGLHEPDTGAMDVPDQHG
jgi:hypothetical protein